MIAALDLVAAPKLKVAAASICECTVGRYVEKLALYTQLANGKYLLIHDLPFDKLA